MRSTTRIRPLRTATLLSSMTAGVALLMTLPASFADTTTNFANFAGDISLNTDLSFQNAPNTGTGQLTFDPNNPDTLYVINRTTPPYLLDANNQPTATGTLGGIFAYSASNKTQLTNSSGNVFLTSNDPANDIWKWPTSTDPYGMTVGLDGSLYIEHYYTAGIFKIANPLSDTPTITRIMSNYNGGGDDDMSGINRMPAKFGLAGYSANDLVFFDTGIDANDVHAVVALHADGSDGNAPTVVWKASGPLATGAIHGAVDDRTGFAYFTGTTPEQNTINGTSYASVYRLRGDGVLQTIGISLPPGITLAAADDPIAINPADGSLWLADVASGVSTMLRVDTNHMTSYGNNQYVATATAEFSATAYNLGVNAMMFTPDGSKLYTGTPSGTDYIYVFNVTAHPLEGDANNDALVNADDYVRIDRGYALHLQGYANGDFNGDNVVDSNDYQIIDTAFASQGGALSPSFLAERQAQFGAEYVSNLLASVPEPASLALAGALLPMLIRRRSTKA